MAAPGIYKYLPPELAESVRDLSISVRRPVHGPKEGRHRSPHYGSSVEFAEYREYTPGDPTNLIDWAVYARSDRYVIRRFHEETNLRAYVLLDTSGSLGFKDEGAMSKMDYACFLAAGLSYALVRQGDSVGLMAFDSAISRTLAPVGTLAGLRELLLALETFKADGRGDIERAIHEAAELIHSKSLVVIISDLLQDPLQTARGLRHLSHDGHNVIVLHVLDRGERRLSFGGVAELKDLETGGRLVVEADDIREAYRQSVERYLNDLRLVCAECLADYHMVDTRIPVEESLNRLQSTVPA